MKMVVMRQVNLSRWQLENDNGLVLKDDIACYSTHEAEQWVIAHISSFQSWGYNMRPLPKKEEVV